jgi:hypothetical protein
MNAGAGLELTPLRFFDASEAAREAAERFFRVEVSLEPSSGGLLGAALLIVSAALLFRALRGAPPPVGRARGFRRGLVESCAPADSRECAACCYASCCSLCASHEVVADVRPGDLCFDLAAICLCCVPYVGFALRCCAGVRRRDASRALVGLGAMGLCGICVEVCLCGPCAIGQELAESRERRARERASGAAKEEEAGQGGAEHLAEAAAAAAEAATGAAADSAAADHSSDLRRRAAAR